MGLGQGERVVLVHDWLTGMRGGEKCLEPLARRWPAARLLTLLHRRGRVAPAIEALAITPSLLNRLPGVDRYYRYLLPLMPFFAGWRVREAELVVSLSHCVAKSARPPEGVPHVCYCFTPMRYAWHLQASYFGQRGVKAQALEPLLARLREWDRRTAQRVTHFIAISRTIQQRIRECYGRESVVIYPPVETDYYTPLPGRELPRSRTGETGRGDYYLVVSALAPYKRFDLAIAACRRLGRPLVVIGTGQALKRCQALAGPTVTFLGWQPDHVIRDHYRQAKALLFPAEEDFGIVPLEAQACGCPVIAYGRGGATETIKPLGSSPEPTGVFFHEQTLDALVDAIERFERHADGFDPKDARRQALQFRRERYESELFAYLEQVRQGGQPVRQAA